MKTRVLSLILALVLAVALSSSASAQGALPGSIKSVRVSGDVSVTVKSTGVKSALSENASISQGDVVTTGMGSSVVLVFSNGATVNLAANSELDITQFTQDPFSTAFSPAKAKAEPTTSTTKLNLVHGELVSKVLKLNVDRGSEFVVNTPVGAAGIRGTVFRITYNVDLLTGAVTFSLVTQVGNVAVTLASGTGSKKPVSVVGGGQLTFSATVSTNPDGSLTVTLPGGATETIATPASTATLQQIADSAAVIAQAVVNLIVPPPPSRPGTTSAPVILINPINPATVP